MASRDNKAPRMSPHYFKREDDGSVRLRIRLDPEEAALIEEGAGTTPLMLYIHRVLKERATYHIKKRAEALERDGSNGLAPVKDEGVEA